LIAGPLDLFALRHRPVRAFGHTVLTLEAIAAALRDRNAGNAKQRNGKG
jgi:hypothetical protein